jgi:hypothetical protein
MLSKIQPRLPGLRGRADAEVLVGVADGFAAAGGTGEKADLQEVRLDDFDEGDRFFAEGGGEEGSR